MALCTASCVNSGISSVSGLDFIVLSGVGTVWLWSDLQKSVHILGIYSLPGVISPDSFLMLIMYCLFLCFFGLVIKASASGAEDPGFKSRLRRDFSGSSHTSDLKIGTPVATLPGAWYYRVSAGTGWPGVSILGEMESSICNFYLSVAARKIVCTDPSLRYTSMLLGR